VTRIQALEHEVDRLRRIVDRRDAKIIRIYERLAGHTKLQDMLKDRKITIKDQSVYIKNLKNLVEDLGGDWHDAVDYDKRVKERAKITCRGNERKSV
jgi:hypothetical protein